MGGRAQNSDTVTGGGRVLTRSKGVSRWENVTVGGGHSLEGCN